MGVCVCNTGTQFFLDAISDQCKHCSLLFANCASCTDTPSIRCSLCNNNYFPSADGSVCLPCLPLCDTCTNNSTCTLCMAGYTTEADGSCTCAGACSLCIANSSGACPVCTIGTPTICHDCAVGFYHNTATTCINCPTALHC